MLPLNPLFFFLERERREREILANNRRRQGQTAGTVLIRFYGLCPVTCNDIFFNLTYINLITRYDLNKLIIQDTGMFNYLLVNSFNECHTTKTNYY